MAKRYLTPSYKTVLNPLTSFSIPKTLWDNASKHVYQGYEPFKDIRDKSLVEALIEIVGLQVQRLKIDYLSKLEVIELDECLYILLNKETKENSDLDVSVFEIIEIESREYYQKIPDSVKNRYNTLNYLFNDQNKMTTIYYREKLKRFLKEQKE
jgi:hypothetical protein|nr:MAG TPA: hypothetical protein [Caudoviricetes sp.]